MKEVIDKIRKYCAYQDRAESEVRQKLRQYEVTGEEADHAIAQLKEDGFIDEERFAESFVRGKTNAKKWGCDKIKSHLMAKGISASIIDKYLSKVNPEQYSQNLRETISKWLRLHPGQPAESPALYRHLLSKGYAYHDFKPEIDALSKS